MRNLSADGDALLVRETRLLDVDVDVAHGLRHAHRFMLYPPGVRIGDEAIARRQAVGDRPDARDVDVGIAAYFELESPVPLGAIVRDLVGHFVGGLLRDGTIQVDVVAVTAAEELAHGKPRRLAKNVPARD